MGYCTRCGTFLGEYASGTCSSCQTSQHGTGGPEDVPCQRCGMYLPSHELKMWNSRLYCAYCIMDVQDEDERHRKQAAERRPTPAAESGRGGAEGAGAGVPLEIGKGSGTCERCGRSAEQLYSLSGRRVCGTCYADVSGSPPASTGPSFFAQIVVRAKQALGIGKNEEGAPKIIAAERIRQGRAGGKMSFDIESRKMIEKKDDESSRKDGKKDEKKS